MKREKHHEGRFWVTYADTYTFNGKVYEIISKPSGAYTRILKAVFEVIEAAERKWRRVALIRFDLHTGGLFFEDNAIISKFRKNLIRKIERRYNFTPLYAWAREVEANLHYHFLLLVDAELVAWWTVVYDLAAKTWVNLNPLFSMPKIKHPYHNLADEEERLNAIKRASYLAKVKSKNARKISVNDYQTSQARK